MYSIHRHLVMMDLHPEHRQLVLLDLHPEQQHLVLLKLHPEQQHLVLLELHPEQQHYLQTCRVPWMTQMTQFSTDPRLLQIGELWLEYC
jgi:hypothetical protein